MAEKNKNAAWADCCEDWGGYMAAKKAKLEEQFQEAAKNEFADPSTLFNGIAIFVNGYTNPTADELKRLMMAHGGTYHHYLRSHSTTHTIASNLPYSKIVAYRKAQNPLPLCKPEWITDSIKAGKLLDYREYLLYSQCTKTQPSIFSHVTKQVREQVETKTSSDYSNSTNHNGTRKLESQVKSIETKHPPKVQSTLNLELPSAVANSTKNPEFLSDFYNNSRLHHISTMGAMFKDYINDLRDKSDGKYPGLEALKNHSYLKYSKAGPSTSAIIEDLDSDEELFGSDCSRSTKSPVISPALGKNQVIMHIDMDCFFVSVGLRNNPELKGCPVAVAHAKGNKTGSSNDLEEIGSMSEIASCSYEARKTGVKNGMFLGNALKLCPNLKTIRYDFEGYKEVSHTLYNTIASYTLDIEAVSCDEMYVDCTKILKSAGLTSMEFANVLRNEIKEKTGCPVSTGFGANKLQARLATKKAKPDGQYHLKGNDIKYFIRTLNVRDLPGVGYSTSRKLQQMGVLTCNDLENVSLYQLQKEFGKKTGQQLHDMCRGIDHNKLNLEHVRKSVSAEVNYGIRFENKNDAHQFLKKLSDEISDRLKKFNTKGKCITLKVMFRAKDAPVETRKFMGHGICDVVNKSKNLIALTDDPVIITREVLALWDQINEKAEDARGIGIQVTKLESLKNKSNGLLKFIDKMKVIESNVNEVNDFINENIEVREKNSEFKKINFQELNKISNELSKEVLSSDENSDSRDANEITLILESQSLPNNVQSNGECSKSFQNKNCVNSVNNNVKTNVKEQSITEVQSKLPSQLKQTTQLEYFKNTKPSSSGKSSKFKMPDLQEIDMEVLIELPEDIRNEILNEYAKNKNNDNAEGNNGDVNAFPEAQSAFKNKDRVPAEIINRNMHDKTRNVHHEDSISFSQIDPDFLAALPNEMKNEVKSYCDAQRKAKIDHANKGWNMFKNEKKTQKPVKSNRGRPKKLDVAKVGAKAGKKETKNITPPSNDKNLREPRRMIKGTNRMENFENNRHIEEFEESPANQTIYFEPTNGNAEHSDILTNLVKCLLELTIPQVKIQIREWINKNEDVNDVDFLSITTYLGTLPRKKRIEDLHILLKLIHRCMKKSLSCVWHETYRKMLKHIQARMREEYGCNIMIPEDVDCEKCKRDQV